MTNSVMLTDINPPEPGELIHLKEGIYWLRMPLPMKLDHINLYMIDEGDGWSIIDTGMNLPDSKKLWETIFTRYCDEKPVKHVYVTHMHPDHVGLAGWIVDQWQCAFYMTQAEYFACRSYTAKDLSPDTNIKFYRSCGMQQAFLDCIEKPQFRMSDLVAPLPDSYRRLRQGDTLAIGGHSWQVVTGEGHTFEHACLYSKSLDILIAGDQLLPEITPNVSVHAIDPDASPLSAWYESLVKLADLHPDTWVLPAHNKPFSGLHARIEELKVHHECQLDKLLVACETTKTVSDLLPVLFYKKISFYEMPLAVGECCAHLNMLIERRLISCSMINGVKYYQKILS